MKKLALAAFSLFIASTTSSAEFDLGVGETSYKGDSYKTTQFGFYADNGHEGFNLGPKFAIGSGSSEVKYNDGDGTQKNSYTNLAFTLVAKYNTSSGLEIGAEAGGKYTDLKSSYTLTKTHTTDPVQIGSFVIPGKTHTTTESGSSQDVGTDFGLIGYTVGYVTEGGTGIRFTFGGSNKMVTIFQQF